MNPPSNPFAKLFEELATSRMSLQVFTEAYPSEDESVEYKTVPKETDGWGEKVRNIFSEAAGAMANTNGGLIIWGVACEQQRRGKGLPPRDRVTELRGVGDADTLIDLLRAFEATVSDPPILGIRHTKVEDKFVVSFIPRSNHGPHQSKAAQGKYLMRVGGSSVPMPHRMVADAILAKKSPQFKLQVKQQCLVTKASENFRAVFEVAMINTSPVTATEVNMFLHSRGNLKGLGGNPGVSPNSFSPPGMPKYKDSVTIPGKMHPTYCYAFQMEAEIWSKWELLDGMFAELLVCATDFACLFAFDLKLSFGEQTDRVSELNPADPMSLEEFLAFGRIPAHSSVTIQIDESKVIADEDWIIRGMRRH